MVKLWCNAFMSLTWNSILQNNPVTLMGILNITPDSFSKDGVTTLQATIDRFHDLIKQGATIIDIGAESTNPKADVTSEEEEWQRLYPFLAWLQHQKNNNPHLYNHIFISLDSYKPAIMRKSLSLGVIDILNDIKGFRSDDAIAVLKEYPNCLAIMMHMNGDNPQNMQSKSQLSEYEEKKQTVTEHVISFFQKQNNRLTQEGIDLQRFCYDVGIGFGKTFEHNIELLKNHKQIKDTLSKNTLQTLFLMGLSRKSFLGQVIAEHIRDNHSAQDRIFAGLSAQLFSIEKGHADIIRTHDVQAMNDVLKMWELLNC
jgi:dihydropteroate synthase